MTNPNSYGGAPESGATYGGNTTSLALGQTLTFDAPAFDGPAGTRTAIEGPAKFGEVGIAVPGLILGDVSWSMEALLATVQMGFGDLAKGLRQHAAVSSNAFLGISTFADTARTELPLTRIADPSVIVPQLAARGEGTNFHAALTEALHRFRTDLPLLARAADGGKRQIFRPSLFMFTDGEHNTGGDWRVPLAELKSRSWAPQIMVFGWGEADRAVIKEIASEGMAYFAEDGQTPEKVLDAILRVILRSMISATITAAGQVANPSAPATVAVVDPKADPATAGLALIDPISSDID